MNIDTYYLNMAEAASIRSKCVSLKVGCVLVRNDKVLATGVNGTPRGTPNCCDNFPDGNCDEHHHWSLDNEVHAEMNAIMQAERSLDGCTAYVTICPCRNCLKHLLAVGTKRIVYRTAYYRMTRTEMIKLEVYCEDNDVTLIKEGE